MLLYYVICVQELETRRIRQTIEDAGRIVELYYMGNHLVVIVEVPDYLEPVFLRVVSGIPRPRYIKRCTSVEECRASLARYLNSVRGGRRKL